LDLRGFARRIRDIGERVERNADELVPKVALAIDQGLVVRTPVDTGRARSNWRVSIGTGLEGVIDAYVKGEAGNTGGANAQAALLQAKGVLMTYRGKVPVYITNNLPYIVRLNEGWSAQAPAGFVELAIQEGVAAVNSARLLK
jgi:hypothetical protein